MEIDTLTELLLFITVVVIVYVGYSLLFSYWYAYWFNIAVLERIPYLDLKIPFADRIFRDTRPGRKPWTLRIVFGVLMFMGSIAMLGFSYGYVVVLIRSIRLILSGQGFG